MKIYKNRCYKKIYSYVCIYYIYCFKLCCDVISIKYTLISEYNPFSYNHLYYYVIIHHSCETKQNTEYKNNIFIQNVYTPSHRKFITTLRIKQKRKH